MAFVYLYLTHPPSRHCLLVFIPHQYSHEMAVHSTTDSSPYTLIYCEYSQDKLFLMIQKNANVLSAQDFNDRYQSLVERDSKVATVSRLPIEKIDFISLMTNLHPLMRSFSRITSSIHNRRCAIFRFKNLLIVNPSTELRQAQSHLFCAFIYCKHRS